VSCLHSELEVIFNSLSSQTPIEATFLDVHAFGSVELGTANANSDIDLAAVVKTSLSVSVA
jgi:hypothetical protein